MFDISDTIVPRSDQVNAEDLLSGPRTVTITGVEAGSAEQPVFIHLAEFPGRTYRPSKTERRILVGGWGPQASGYVGRRITIYRDPEVTFGRDKVGGIRISAMSHIEKPLSLALTVTRGKRVSRVVEPLPADTRQDDLRTILERAHKARTKNELRPLYKAAVDLEVDEKTATELLALANTLPDAEAN